MHPVFKTSKELFKCFYYIVIKMDNLLIDLNEFKKSLNHAESHLIVEVDSTSSMIF